MFVHWTKKQKKKTKKQKTKQKNKKTRNKRAAGSARAMLAGHPTAPVTAKEASSPETPVWLSRQTALSAGWCGVEGG